MTRLSKCLAHKQADRSTWFYRLKKIASVQEEEKKSTLYGTILCEAVDRWPLSTDRWALTVYRYTLKKPVNIERSSDEFLSLYGTVTGASAELLPKRLPIKPVKEGKKKYMKFKFCEKFRNWANPLSQTP